MGNSLFFYFIGAKDSGFPLESYANGTREMPFGKFPKGISLVFLSMKNIACVFLLSMRKNWGSSATEV